MIWANRNDLSRPRFKSGLVRNLPNMALIGVGESLSFTSLPNMIDTRDYRDS